MVYSPQPEIQAYWVAVHKKHNLQAFTQYDSSFESARWNSSKSVYEIKFARQSDKSQVCPLALGQTDLVDLHDRGRDPDVRPDPRLTLC